MTLTKLPSRWSKKTDATIARAFPGLKAVQTRYCLWHIFTYGIYEYSTSEVSRDAREVGIRNLLPIHLAHAGRKFKEGARPKEASAQEEEEARTISSVIRALEEEEKICEERKEKIREILSTIESDLRRSGL